MRTDDSLFDERRNAKCIQAVLKAGAKSDTGIEHSD